MTNDKPKFIGKWTTTNANAQVLKTTNENRKRSNNRNIHGMTISFNGDGFGHYF